MCIRDRNQPPASTFTEFFELIEAMIDSLIVNRFFYTVDELGRATPEFYRHNVDMVSQIENHLELSLQRLSDREFLVPWLSDDEPVSYTHLRADLGYLSDPPARSLLFAQRQSVNRSFEAGAGSGTLLIAVLHEFQN